METFARYLETSKPSAKPGDLASLFSELLNLFLDFSLKASKFKRVMELVTANGPALRSSCHGDFEALQIDARESCLNALLELLTRPRLWRGFTAKQLAILAGTLIDQGATFPSSTAEHSQFHKLMFVIEDDLDGLKRSHPKLYQKLTSVQDFGDSSYLLDQLWQLIYRPNNGSDVDRIVRLIRANGVKFREPLPDSFHSFWSCGSGSCLDMLLGLLVRSEVTRNFTHKQLALLTAELISAGAKYPVADAERKTFGQFLDTIKDGAQALRKTNPELYRKFIASCVALELEA